MQVGIIDSVELNVIATATGNSVNISIDDNLTVTWTGVSPTAYAPTEYDWIAFYCGEDVLTVLDVNYLDYAYVSQLDAGDWEAGFGQFEKMLTTTARYPEHVQNVPKQRLLFAWFIKCFQSGQFWGSIPAPPCLDGVSR